MSEGETLDDIVAGIAPAGEAAVTAHIPAHWMQGRTSYGGLSTALAYEATRRTLGELPPLRSALVAFIGPVGAEVALRSRVLRAGKSTVFAEADAATEADGLGLRVGFVFAADRESALSHAPPPAPAAPPPEDCLPMFGPGGPRPGFAGNFEVRLAGGSRPFSGGEPVLLVWARMKQAFAGDPVTELLALADVLPPAMMTRFTGPMRISSMTWNVDLVNATAPTRDRWRLVGATARTAANGYSVQEMGLWTTAGEVVLYGSQNVAMFG